MRLLSYDHISTILSQPASLEWIQQTLDETPCLELDTLSVVACLHFGFSDEHGQLGLRPCAEVLRDLRENRKLFAGVMNALENRLEDEEKTKVVVGGPSNLLHYPEYSDVGRARDFLSVLESREKLYPLLRTGGSMEFTIRIGPETGVPELSGCSVVTATYRVDDQTSGTIGVIGPTRMHYGHVLSALGTMGRLLTNVLSRTDEDGNK